jgi:hypothetical protein
VSKPHIPKVLRAKVAAQAKNRCGYCLMQEEVVGMAMEIDHLIPKSQQGSNKEENLWLACSTCNDIKNDRTVDIDPLSGDKIALFNPRTQIWREHFAWTDKGERIIGLTPVGRATVIALKLNRVYLIRARRIWVKAGVHPPDD